MVRWLGILLGVVLFLPGCGDGALAEETPSSAAASLSIQFDSPLARGVPSTARGTTTIIVDGQKHIGSFGPVVAQQYERGLLVTAEDATTGGSIYVRVDDAGITMTWTSSPDTDK